MTTEFKRCLDCSPDTRRRVLATADNEAPRCATHLRAFKVRQRKQAQASAVQRTYDLSPEDNHALFMLQGGKCWLCQKATGATKSLAVDHDHATSEVRGRLCGPCNQFIGRALGDDPEAARRLVAYLMGDTPYRRMKASQTLAQREGVPVVVHRVYRTIVSQELWAEWSWATGTNTAVHWHTSVRDFDGNWRAMPGSVQAGTVT